VAQYHHVSDPVHDKNLADNGGSDQRPLVSAKWLYSHLDKPNIKVIDCSWRMQNPTTTPAQEYEEAHIPGAVYVDVDAIADLTNPKPHTAPQDPAIVAEMLGGLGITEKDTIVVYDNQNMLASPRLWWMLTTYGAHKVRILEGGFAAWKSAKYPIEKGPGKQTGSPKKIHKHTVGVAKFHPHFHQERLAKLPEILKFVEGAEKQSAGQHSATLPYVFDARAPGRFQGTDPEPRPGLESGHMPGAINTPFSEFTAIDEQQQVARFKSEPELKEVFKKAGVDIESVDPSHRIIATCGSGMTAATVYLGLHILGRKNIALYDGSWIEYANPQLGNKIVKGK